MKIPKLKTRNIDVSELAARVVGEHLNERFSLGELDDLLCDKLDVSYEQFEKVVAALMPYTTLTQSPRGDNHYRIGFVNYEDAEYILMVEFKDEEK